MSTSHGIDIFTWEGEGYRPFLVSHRDWLVALMNWEPRFDAAQAGRVERHNQTDEVFVLTRGHGLLVVDSDQVIQVVDMQPRVIYNVTRGTWHSVIGTRDSSWLIVEASDMGAIKTDYRQLTEDELAQLRGQYPGWI